MEHDPLQIENADLRTRIAALQQRVEAVELERVCNLCRSHPETHPAVICDSHYRQLLTDRDALRAGLGRAVEALRHYEWRQARTNLGAPEFSYCPCCGKVQESGHASDCLVGIALTPSALSAGEEWAKMREIVRTAQWIAKRTPRPPTAITYEVGVDIVNLVQEELYPVLDALSPHPTPTTPGPHADGL